MTDRLTLRLWNPVQAHQAIQSTLWPMCKAMLTAGHRMVLELRPETRTIAQNNRLHAMCTDLEKQCVWHGKKLNKTIWKRLCMASWLREKGENPLLIPALDGNGFDIVFEKTSKLSVAHLGELMEWIAAFGAEQGVHFADEREYVDAETGEILEAA